jgi:hypothetical protein
VTIIEKIQAIDRDFCQMDTGFALWVNHGWRSGACWAYYFRVGDIDSFGLKDSGVIDWGVSLPLVSRVSQWWPRGGVKTFTSRREIYPNRLVLEEDINIYRKQAMDLLSRALIEAERGDA